MPSFKATTKDGQEGSFDPVASLMAARPELAKARITGYDAKTKTIKAVSDEQEMELNVPEYAKSLGLNVAELEGDFNDASTAVDSSPVSLWQRVKLGLANSESGDAKMLLDRLSSVSSGPALDARDEKNQRKALAFLKADGFDDAKMVNGEYVVKKDGVWHRVDSPGMQAGDLAQFAAGNGLNIIASIAGGAAGAVAGSFVPGAGTAAGAIGGSAGGAALAEAGEEALRIALVGGEVDFEGAAQDIFTEGLMGLVGEGATRAVVGGGKLAAKGAGAVASATGADDAARSLVKGLKGFASKASSSVKDKVASLYGGIGADMAAETTREMLESPETVQQALAAGKTFASGGAGQVRVYDDMVDTLANALDNVQDANQKEYGKLVGEIAKAAEKDGTFSINLTEIREQLTDVLKGRGLLEGASPEKRSFIDPALNIIKEMEEKLAPKKAASTLLDSYGKEIPQNKAPVMLKGSQAIMALHRIKLSTTEKVGKLGGFNKAAVQPLTDANTLNAALDMEHLIDSKIINASKQFKMLPELERARDIYGATKDALLPLKSKVFSEKRPIDNVVKALRNESGIDIDTAFKRFLPDADMPLPGGDKVTKALKRARVIQSGIETHKWLSIANPKENLKQAALGGGAVALATTAPVVGVPLLASVISPKAAGFIARNMTSSGGMAQGVSRATKMSADGAAKAARLLTTRASIAGFMHSLTREQKDNLLRDGNAFNELIGKSEALEQKAMSIDEAAVMNAAVEASQKPKGAK